MVILRISGRILVTFLRVMETIIRGAIWLFLRIFNPYGVAVLVIAGLISYMNAAENMKEFMLMFSFILVPTLSVFIAPQIIFNFGTLDD